MKNMTKNIHLEGKVQNRIEETSQTVKLYFRRYWISEWL